MLALGTLANAQSRDPEPRLVRCYPSPATTYVQFEWKGQSKPATLQIFNGATGKRMLVTVSVGSEGLRINLSEYPRGLYIFQLYSANGSLLDIGKFYVVK